MLSIPQILPNIWGSFSSDVLDHKIVGKQYPPSSKARGAQLGDAPLSAWVVFWAHFQGVITKGIAGGSRSFSSGGTLMDGRGPPPHTRHWAAPPLVQLKTDRQKPF